MINLLINHHPHTTKPADILGAMNGMIFGRTPQVPEAGAALTYLLDGETEIRCPANTKATFIFCVQLQAAG